MNEAVSPRRRTVARVTLTELSVGLVVALVALGLFSLEWFYSLSNWNFFLRDGVSTVGAERILAGDVPYRDFWTMYAPGHFYLIALLFRMFGTNLLVEVVAASVVSAAGAYVCYQFVLTLTRRPLAGVVCAGVFVSAMYTTGYFKRLGSYPPAILLILVALWCLTLFYQRGELRFLLIAGLATGIAAVFKHDVAGYTAIAVVVGLVVHNFLTSDIERMQPSFLSKFVTYSASTALPALPVVLYFGYVAGRPMLEDLIIFPLTDFRYARPEEYPSLLPVSVFDPSPLVLVQRITEYIYFTIPFGLFLLGLVAVGVAVSRRNYVYAALGVTLAVGFLLHFEAAHIQINTHIITMSVYAAIAGVMFYDLFVQELTDMQRTVVRVAGVALVAGWLLALAAKPIYIGWNNRAILDTPLTLPKVSGFRVAAREADVFTGLVTFVQANTAPNQTVFVAAHRNDVIVTGDVMIYFLLDRPIATKHHELHPAITDTADVQREMIADLQDAGTPVIITKHIFADETLDAVKQDFLKNLPIGATELDTFIQENYTPVRTFGPYKVWFANDAGETAIGHARD